MSSSEKNETNATTTTSSSGRCPVDHTKIGANTTSLWKVFGINGTSSSSSSSSSSSQEEVVVVQKNKEKEECNSQSIVASLEEAAKYAQVPHPEQRLPLSTHRTMSSIPRGISDKPGPHHQPKSLTNGGEEEKKEKTQSAATATTSQQQPPQSWVYPSEQQVFNAMKRKGWNEVEETSIPSFLQIHNHVNEMSWRELCKWEEKWTVGNNNNNNNTNNTNNTNNNNRNDDKIKLVRFQGRPNTLTPKAWLMSTFFFQEKPFDRHDWYIDNGIEHEKRYVLDFYMKEETRNATTTTPLPRVIVDVRPALDTPQAVLARAQRLAQDMFPGITYALKKYYSNNQQQQQQQHANTTTTTTTTTTTSSLMSNLDVTRQSSSSSGIATSNNKN